jgi:hypothetical protein
VPHTHETIRAASSCIGIETGDGCAPSPNSRARGCVERGQENGAKADCGNCHRSQGNHQKAHWHSLRFGTRNCRGYRENSSGLPLVPVMRCQYRSRPSRGWVFHSRYFPTLAAISLRQLIDIEIARIRHCWLLKSPVTWLIVPAFAESPAAGPGDGCATREHRRTPPTGLKIAILPAVRARLEYPQPS